MAQQRKPFDKLFSQLQDIRDKDERLLSTVLWSQKGNPSILFKIENPVQQYCTNTDLYYLFQDALANIIKTLGERYTLQKQGILCKQEYHHEPEGEREFLTKSYFNYFKEREYVDIRTFLIVMQECAHNAFVKYDAKRWEDFHVKVAKVADILQEKGIAHHELSKSEIDEYLHHFIAFQLKWGPFSMIDFKCPDENLKISDRTVKSFPLADIDEINVPSFVRPFLSVDINGTYIATDLFSFLTEIPYTDCAIYSQVMQVPARRRLIRKLRNKAEHHGPMPGSSNRIAKEDIGRLLDTLVMDSKLMVYTNLNILVSCPHDKITPVTSYIKTKLYDYAIMPSHSAYNQLELFTCSSPSNGYAFNPDYNLFLTLSNVALCLCFEEYLKHFEETPLKTCYIGRQGLPMTIDITGREGVYKYTDNANFFCIGPSGSGKSLHMNSVMHQLPKQNTDVVMVDTGDSYEGMCSYFGGTYITYSKDHPTSVNPFKVTKTEYRQNSGEKRNFLKSLIFLVYKGSERPSKIEDAVINQVIMEYYDASFHPFRGFSAEEEDRLRHRLLLEDEKNGEYEKYGEKVEHSYYQDFEGCQGNTSASVNSESRDTIFSEAEVAYHIKAKRQVEKLHALVSGQAATRGEKVAVNRQLMHLMAEVIEGSYLMRIEQEIEKMGRHRRKTTIWKLSFSTLYGHALERILQLMTEKRITFDVDNFAAIFERFYCGGELECILDNDLEQPLFDERFIVFRVDRIKDGSVLLPIMVLIIMDVLPRKTCIKKGRKTLIIEGAWKAIALPTMTGYIKYLYKTVRKFHGIAGVITQELNDVIDSPIVKETIISNNDVKILLDQTEFKDRYGDIAAILGLTTVQRQQIFTINSLNNRKGRNYFKKVWICRGQVSDMYGVEKLLECCWTYTTERTEKEALKVYAKHCGGNIQRVITETEKDREKAGTSRYFDFARHVNEHRNIMSLWRS